MGPRASFCRILIVMFKSRAHGLPATIQAPTSCESMICDRFHISPLKRLQCRESSKLRDHVSPSHVKPLVDEMRSGVTPGVFEITSFVPSAPKSMSCCNHCKSLLSSTAWSASRRVCNCSFDPRRTISSNNNTRRRGLVYRPPPTMPSQESCSSSHYCSSISLCFL